MSLGIDLSDRERATSVSAVRCDSMPWIDDPTTGGKFMLLHVDKYSGLWVVRSRFRPSTTVPVHLHSGPVSAVTLSGDWTYPELGVVCGPGDYLVEDAGTVHSLSVLGGVGVDIIFSIVGSITYFTPNGEVNRIEDWKTVLSDYLDGCRAVGIDPAVIGLNTRHDGET